MLEFYLQRENIIKLFEDLKALFGINLNLYSTTVEDFILVTGSTCEYCKQIRQDPKIDSMCKQIDKEATRISFETKNTYIYECHSGICEVVMPIIINDCIPYYVFFGQFLKSKPTEDFWHNTKINQILSENSKEEIEEIKEKLFDLKHFENMDEVERVIRVVKICINYILASNFITLKKSNEAEVCLQYINNNYNKEIKIDELCRMLYIGKSSLNSKIRKEINTSLRKYIETVRIEKAKHFLITTDFTIMKISEEIGFNEANYFTRVFKRNTKLSPSAYREEFYLK